MVPNLNIDNELLIKECVNGNTVALNEFYSRFAPKMYSVVIRYVGNPDDARDILHDGFLVAYSRLSSLRNPDSVEYWLASIMKNLSLQFLQAQDVVTLLHELPELPDTPDFYDIIDLPTLESLIQKLPKGYQRVFRLSVLEHKTHKEIAKILGIAPNSSSSQLFHAKMMMRSLISDYRREAGLLSLLFVAGCIGFLYWRNTTEQSHQKLPLLSVAEHIEEFKNKEENNGVDKPVKPLIKNDSEPQIARKRAHKINSPIERLIISENTLDISDILPADTIKTSMLIAENDELSTEISDPIPQITHVDVCDMEIIDTPRYVYSVRSKAEKNNLFADYSVKVAVSSGSSVSHLSAYRSNIFFNGTLNAAPDLSTAYFPKGEFKNIAHSSHLPFIVKLSLNKPLSNVIGIESGLAYSYMYTTVENKDYHGECRWHYVGIPLKITINNFSNKKCNLYASAGLQMDIPVYSVASASSVEAIGYLPHGPFHSSVVWSLGASYGIALTLTKHVGLFIEPSLEYHLPHNYKIPNAWTDNRVNFSLPIGIRLNF